MSKRVALSVAVCLVAVACGGGGKSSVGVGSADLIPKSTTTLAQTDTSAQAATQTTSRPPGAPKSTGHSTGTLPYYGGPRGGSGDSLPTLNSGGQDPAALGGSGSYARVLLHPAPATSIVMELLEQSGASPNQAAVNYDAGMVHKVTQKPTSISKPISVPGGPESWNTASLAQLVDKYGTKNLTGAKTAVLHLVIVHGQLANGPQVLGVAFRGDILAIFPDQTRGTISLTSNQVAEAIYTHETGHLLGMVDEVLHDGRADPNDPNQPSAHNPDKQSVMYYAIDTTGLTTVFAGGPPTDFDAADYADFARLRAGA